MTHRVAIIGGGISGLASALRTSALGHRVTLFESADDLGGLATTFPYAGGDLEKFYHCILPNDDALLSIIRELGLEQDLLWRETAMGFMYQRDVYSLNTPLDLLRFSPLRIDERIRLGLMAIYSRFRGMSEELDRITAEQWLRGMIGNRAFDLVWKPLLSAKIGDFYSAIPALWLSSRLHREKNTGLEQKGVLRHGYRSLIDALGRSLQERGATLRLKTGIRALQPDDFGVTVILDDGSRERFDYVVSTAPIPTLCSFAQDFPLDSRVTDLDLDYQGVINGMFLLDKPLSRYYWMPFVDCGATAQGVIEMSNLQPLERSQGLYVTYLVNYTHRDSELFNTDEDVLLARYRRDLDQLFAHTGARVVDQFLFRAPFVEPIWTLGYGSRKPPTTLIPGRLYASTTAHLYPRVNSWNSCCEVVEEMMPELIEQTAATAPGVVS